MASGDIIRRILTTFGVDASQYQRGAAQVQQANAEMVASGAKVVEQQQTAMPRAVSTSVKSMERLEAQVDRAVRAQQAQQRQLDLVNRAYQEGTITQQRHAELTKKIEENYRRQTAATKQAEAQTKSFGESIRGVTGLLAGLGIYLGTRQLATWVRGSLDAVGGLGELAQQLGVTTDALQVYRYGATQAGLTSSELETGLARLTRTIGDAAKGEKEATDAFKAAGVAYRDSSGAIRSTEAVVRDLADRLTQIHDPAQQAAILVDLFGKSGQKLLPLLSQGTQGISAMEQAARRLGVVLDEETIAAADKAADKLAEIQLVLTTNVQRAFVEVAPAVLRIAELLGDAIPAAARVLAGAIKFVVDNLELFGSILLGLAIGKAIELMLLLANAVVGLGKALLALNLNPLVALATLALVAVAAIIELSRGADYAAEAVGNAAKAADQLDAALKVGTVSSKEQREALIAQGEAALFVAGMMRAMAEASIVASQTSAKALFGAEALAFMAGDGTGQTDAMKSLAALDDEIARLQKQLEDIRKLKITSGGGPLDPGALSESEKAFKKLAESIADATDDLKFQANLVGRSAYDVDYLTQSRKLLNAALATGNKIEASTLALITEQAKAYADANQVLRDRTSAQKAADDATKKAVDDAKATAKQFEQDVSRVADSIADDLTTALFEGGKNGFDDILSNIGEWVRRIGLEILKQQIILPITTQLVGAVPWLFGISGGGTGTIGGTNIFGAVTSLASDTFDWLGRTLGFGGTSSGPLRHVGGAGSSAANFAGSSGLDLGSLLGSAALGYGVGSLVGGFSPFGRTGPGSSIGGALGGLAGSFLPFPGGDLIGGLLGSLVGSLFGPKPSNGPFGLGTARATGGRLAYTTTQNLKGGVGDMTPLVNETIGVANQLADIFGAEFTDKANIRIGYVNAENGTKGYVVSGAGRPGTNDAFNKWKNFGENKQAAELFAIKQAVLGGSFNGLTNGPGLQGLSAEEKTYITKSFGIRTDPQEVLKDAALIVDLFGEQAEAMSEAAAAIKQVNDAYDAQIERAKELGISEAELVRRRDEAIQNLKTGFVEGIQDQILAITDPVAFAIKQLDKDFETIRANAEDFGVGLVDVERLYGLKRQQILEQYAQTTVADLQRFLEQLTFGDLSGASPGSRLSGSRAAFEAAAAQAQAGDATARGRIQDLGTTFLNESRSYNASSSAYYADLARVQEIVRALLGENLPGYASGVANAPGGWSWIGESGREAMYVPRGATILPNAISEMFARGAANDSNSSSGPIREIVKAQMEVTQALRQKLGADEGLRSELRSLGSALRRLLSLIPTDKAA